MFTLFIHLKYINYQFIALIDFPFQLIIDELELTETDKKLISSGEKCELVRLLEELKQRNILTWAVIGVSSLLECSERAEGSVKTFIKFVTKLLRNVDCEVRESTLTSLLSSAGYKVIKLENILRNSRAISQLSDDIRGFIDVNVHFGGGGDVSGPSLLSGDTSRLCSHKSSSNITALSLVESFINLLCHGTFWHKDS